MTTMGLFPMRLKHLTANRDSEGIPCCCGDSFSTSGHWYLRAESTSGPPCPHFVLSPLFMKGEATFFPMLKLSRKKSLLLGVFCSNEARFASAGGFCGRPNNASRFSSGSYMQC